MGDRSRAKPRRPLPRPIRLQVDVPRFDRGPARVSRVRSSPAGGQPAIRLRIGRSPRVEGGRGRVRGASERPLALPSHVGCRPVQQAGQVLPHHAGTRRRRARQRQADRRGRVAPVRARRRQGLFPRRRRQARRHLRGPGRCPKRRGASHGPWQKHRDHAADPLGRGPIQRPPRSAPNRRPEHGQLGPRHLRRLLLRGQTRRGSLYSTSKLSIQSSLSPGGRGSG